MDQLSQAIKDVESNPYLTSKEKDDEIQAIEEDYGEAMEMQRQEEHEAIDRRYGY